MSSKVPACRKHEMKLTYYPQASRWYCKGCEKETIDEAKILFGMSYSQYQTYKKLKKI